MTDKLKPCPFCGGEGSIDHYGCTKVGTMYSCLDCGAHLETGETFNHGQQWNDRPVEDALRAELAKLMSENQRFRAALEHISRMGKSAAEVYMSERTRLAGCIHQANKALKGTKP